MASRFGLPRPISLLDLVLTTANARGNTMAVDDLKMTTLYLLGKYCGQDARAVSLGSFFVPSAWL